MGIIRIMRRLGSETLDCLRDKRSACPAEYCLLFLLLAVAISAIAPFSWLNRLGTYTSTLIPSNEPVQTDVFFADRAYTEKHYSVPDLVKIWALSDETIRQLVKDDPGVVKIRNGRKAAHTTYRVPESAVRRIHSSLGGLEEGSLDQHYRIADLADQWAIGRETARLMIKDEPGVLRIGLGIKRAHITYSVPSQVAKRIHTRLFYAV
jgi:hypothetical protein